MVHGQLAGNCGVGQMAPNDLYIYYNRSFTLDFYFVSQYGQIHFLGGNIL